jgi:hypothetical protein
LYRQYRGRVAFLLVYTREAHPQDGWQVSANLQDNVIVTSPKNAGERTSVAQSCQLGLRLSLPMVIDGMDNAVEAAYASWPDRLYVVGADGRIAYKGAPGPGGFHPEEMQAALSQLLGQSQGSPKPRIVPGAVPGSVTITHPNQPLKPYALLLPQALTAGGQSLLGESKPTEWREVIPGRMVRYEQRLGQECVLAAQAQVDEEGEGIALKVSVRNLSDQPLKALCVAGQLKRPGGQVEALELQLADCQPGETREATETVRF